MASTRMKIPNVLFMCVHNSARSQMAAAFLKKICPDHFEAHSAGFEGGMINSLAIDAMAEVGTDISTNKTQAVFDAWRSGTMFTHVITVCSEVEAAARACPIFPARQSGSPSRLRTLPLFRAATPPDWNRCDPSAMQSRRRSTPGASRSVLSHLRRIVRSWLKGRPEKPRVPGGSLCFSW